MSNCETMLFDQAPPLRLIEGHSDIIYIDVWESNGWPADLTNTPTYFHLMEFSTRDHIWTKKCEPILDMSVNTKNVDYPFTVPVYFLSEDTIGLDGHYTGQLELIDFNNESKRPFQNEIIVDKKASL